MHFKSQQKPLYSFKLLEKIYRLLVKNLFSDNLNSGTDFATVLIAYNVSLKDKCFNLFSILYIFIYFHFFYGDKVNLKLGKIKFN